MGLSTLKTNLAMVLRGIGALILAGAIAPAFAQHYFVEDNHGVTGAWYDPATPRQGIVLEVYEGASGVGLIVGSWLTFDAEGRGEQRWYTLAGITNSWGYGDALTIYQNTGGDFNAPPSTSAVPVGTAEIDFYDNNDCTTGYMAYRFDDGSSGAMSLVRLTPNVTCAETKEGPIELPNADFGYSGNWFDPAMAGQGFVFEVNPIGREAFFAWSTYAIDGQSLGASGQRWYTGEGVYVPGSRTIPVILYETTGGRFDTPEPAAHTEAVGTATATFTSCNAAMLTFAFTGGSSAGASGTINLSRVGPAPVDCVH